jgi:hypothetical protein
MSRGGRFIRCSGRENTMKFDRHVESLIASFRNMPEELFSSRDSGPKEIGSLLESLIERHHIGRRTPEESIQENWVRIVGPDFAKRCRPERIDASGALIVQVPNATVRREMIFHEDRILTVLGSLEGCQHVNRVVLKAGQ